METCGEHGHNREPTVWFKSYYVVWKHTSGWKFCVGGVRLNRTMQYGNLRRRKEVRRPQPGLNRTMQYGNIISGCFTTMSCKFKSYYVVWKLNADKKSKNNGKSLNRTMQYGNAKTNIYTEGVAMFV